jgi:hypothetical protein
MVRATSKLVYTLVLNNRSRDRRRYGNFLSEGYVDREGLNHHEKLQRLVSPTSLRREKGHFPAMEPFFVRIIRKEQMDRLTRLRIIAT